MAAGGVSIVMLLGVLNGVLVLGQLATGMRWIRVSPKVHRRSGLVLVASGLLHGALAILAETL